MEEKEAGFEIRVEDLWAILKRCWWLMLAVLLVVFVTVFAVMTTTHEKEYTATSVVWALGAPSSGSLTTSDVSIGTYLINDYKQLVTTEDVLEEVIGRAELLISTVELSKMISVTHETNTRVMNISVTAGTPGGAELITNTLVDVFCSRVNDKNSEADKNGSGSDLVTVWSYAKVPTDPSNPVSVVKIGLIAAVAAIAVYGVYFVLYLLDDKISTAEDVERYLGVNMLGMIPNRQDVQRRKSKNGYYYSYGANKPGSGGNP
ncbi:MAG: hypothetical protein IJW92_07065 [Clostridia bacterium]|nr:hypothetical protein [Clostridia bacterium]